MVTSVKNQLVFEVGVRKPVAVRPYHRSGPVPAPADVATPPAAPQDVRLSAAGPGRRCGTSVWSAHLESGGNDLDE